MFETGYQKIFKNNDQSIKKSFECLYKLPNTMQALSAALSNVCFNVGLNTCTASSMPQHQLKQFKTFSRYINEFFVQCYEHQTVSIPMDTR